MCSLFYHLFVPEGFLVVLVVIVVKIVIGSQTYSGFIYLFCLYIYNSAMEKVCLFSLERNGR